MIGHHIYTNAFECDPDLPVRQDGDPRRLVPRQVGMIAYDHVLIMKLDLKPKYPAGR